MQACMMGLGLFQSTPEPEISVGQYLGIRRQFARKMIKEINPLNSIEETDDATNGCQDAQSPEGLEEAISQLTVGK